MGSELQAWLPQWQELAIKIARAFVVAVTFELFTFIASRRIEKHLRDVFAADAQRDPARRSRRRVKLRAAVRTACRAVFYPVAFLVMLDIFGFPPLVLSVASVSVAGTVLLAGRSWLQDVMAGLIILGEDQFAVGDVVRIGNIQGVVERMSLRSTWIRSPDQADHVHVIANRLVTAACVPAPSPPPPAG